MSTESEIQTEVESLKSRFNDTKQLYREVCALLFYRHGITPTTNKLYQYVRRGSMSAPADALAKFWDDLRSKARVEIDHPDLPHTVRDAAATAIAAIWQQASEAARSELSGARADAEASVAVARDQLLAVQEHSRALQADNSTVREQLVAAAAGADRLRNELDSERRAHAASAGRIQEVQRTVHDLHAQCQQLQDRFSTELEKARGAVDAATARADGAERRAMIAIDQERQARARAERALEALRAQASQTEDRLRTEAQAATETGARTAARADALAAANRDLQARADQASSADSTFRAQLRTAEDALARAKAEAETLRGVLDRLSPAGVQPHAKPTKARKT